MDYTASGGELLDETNHGFSGHEVDHLGLVHMTRRIYDVNLVSPQQTRLD